MRFATEPGKAGKGPRDNFLQRICGMVAQIFFIFDSASSKNISSRIRLYDRSGSQGKRRSLHAELFISEICRCGLSLSVFQPYRYKQCSSFRILKLLLPHPSLPGSGRSASPYYFVCFSCDVGLLQQKTLASAIPIL